MQKLEVKNEDSDSYLVWGGMVWGAGKKKQCISQIKLIMKIKCFGKIAHLKQFCLTSTQLTYFEDPATAPDLLHREPCHDISPNIWDTIHLCKRSTVK